MFLPILLLSSALAASLSGVTLPDRVSLGGQELHLNGLGLREKYYLDIYVAGLYVPTPSRDPQTLIDADVPKRIVLHVVFSELPKDRLIASFEEDFGKMPNVAGQRSNIDKLESWLPDSLVKGDQLAFDYVPGVGTSMVINGRSLGTIAGTEFMRLIYTIYLGPNPPTAELKRGMLGG